MTDIRDDYDIGDEVWFLHNNRLLRAKVSGWVNTGWVVCAQINGASHDRVLLPAQFDPDPLVVLRRAAESLAHAARSAQNKADRLKRREATVRAQLMEMQGGAKP